MGRKPLNVHPAPCERGLLSLDGLKYSTERFLARTWKSARQPAGKPTLLCGWESAVLLRVGAGGAQVVRGCVLVPALLGWRAFALRGASEGGRAHQADGGRQEYSFFDCAFHAHIGAHLDVGEGDRLAAPAEGR